MKPEELQKYIQQQIAAFKSKALSVVEIEALKSVKKNFEVGGRPPWKKSRKSGRLRGTKTLVVTGNLSNVSAVKNEADSSVTLSTNPLARAYARIHQEGGTINHPARTLRFRKKKYKNGESRTVFASSKHKRGVTEKAGKAYTIKMPPRPYMVIPTEDIEKMKQKISQIKL